MNIWVKKLHTPGCEFRRMHLAVCVVASAMFWLSNTHAAVPCANTITAKVAVLESPTIFNRLGAQNPNWMTFQLLRDVVDKTTGLPCTNPGVMCMPGNVERRADKRPRPLVVRSVEGYCLNIEFFNLLNQTAAPNDPIRAVQEGIDCVATPNAIQCALKNDDQVADRCAGFHASGTELVNGMEDDGSMVGANLGADIGDASGGASHCGPGMAAPAAADPNSPHVTYHLYTPHEGAFVVNSYGATLGSEQNSGNLGIGLFGELNVEPKGAKIYRSQMTEEELRLATVARVLSDCPSAGIDGLFGTVDDQPLAEGEVVGVSCSRGGQPIIDYEALYPNVEPWISEGKAGLPVISMTCNAAAAEAVTHACDLNELVHSDINAIIAGPNPDGSFPPNTYPLESKGKNNPAYPNRLEPFREFASIFHDEQTNSQVFPRWYLDPVMKQTMLSVKDQFMINYGSGGIGSEIVANRLHTGAMHDCTGCAYEEFFLSSQTVGDPGMLNDIPANFGIELCDPGAIAAPSCWRDPGNLANGPIPGNFALYQEDPANVHHGYTGDFGKIRNIHAGAFEQHIFHLHNTQWLFNPNDDNSNYLDAQEIFPGSGHSYELVNGGLGNRNKTAGDAIFHCHFYPHFAEGMWYHIRNHDVMETGTVLAVSGAGVDPQAPALDGTGFHTTAFALRSGQPAVGARALPDGELPDGAPIPAIVPLPGKPMPPMPAPVHVVAVDRGSHSLAVGRAGPDGIPDSSQAVVDYAAAAGADGILHDDPNTPDVDEGADDVSPGFPFFVAGVECGVGAADIEVDGNGFATNCSLGTVGQRAPTPPLDMLTTAGAADAGYNSALAGGWDGGLPRHTLLGYVSGSLSADTQNRLDFRKRVEMAKPVYFPETGTEMEKVSMAYHAVREHSTFAQDFSVLGGAVKSGNDVNFELNGAPPVPGAPFQDPCIDDAGEPLKSGVVGHWFDGDGNPNTLHTRGSSSFTSENPRTYQVANVQIDAVFNKVGYHYPQERIISLWRDVAPTILKQRSPQPLVMRFNTFDCGKLQHSNLVPNEYELDDFQVRTPTDIIGQHIHLPKWDLTTDDGAANGWNYEDGTLSPGTVKERILAINAFNEKAGNVVPAGTFGPTQLAPIDLTDLEAVPTIDSGDSGGTPAGLTKLTLREHPFFGAGVATQDHLGARTTLQRILVDPVVNVKGIDRGLGMTFSHDHFGPSTFQQIGLYSTILAEPAGSTWVHSESGVPLGTRVDGGPTHWAAAILPPASAPGGSNVGAENIPDHREFYFEMSDFQHAYVAGAYFGANDHGVPIEAAITQPNPFNATDATAPALLNAWKQAINPPNKFKAVSFPDVVASPGACPGPAGEADPNIPRPCAQAINVSHSAMWVTSYRNEPVGLRVFDPNAPGPDNVNGTQTAGLPGDLAFALQSRMDRAIPELNTSMGVAPYPRPAFCQGAFGDDVNCDRRPGDPFTPIMRAYERDHIKVKIQVGATEEQHQLTMHGLKWLSNGSGFGRAGNSGWRNFQSHGISEQFSLQLPLNPDHGQIGNTVDYLYAQDATRDGFWSGTWGVLRSYGERRQDLFELPDNPQRGSVLVTNAAEFDGVCPTVREGQGRNAARVIANLREYDVTAVLANDVLPKPLSVTIPTNIGGDSDGDGTGDNTGGLLNPAGGTLVYNRRGTTVPDVFVPPAGAEPGGTFVGGTGPLNDPTAMMYVMTSDLVPANPLVCTDVTDPTCPVRLSDTAPVEPLVLRANAGDCIEVTLRNRLMTDQAVLTADGTPVVDADGLPVIADIGGQLFVLDLAGVSVCGGQPCTLVAAADVTFDIPPDLAGWQDVMWVVTRNIVPAAGGIPGQMHFFSNNLVRPSGFVGLHPQLVEFDSSQDDGVVVGQNAWGTSLVAPGQTKLVRWYAGDIQHVSTGTRRGGQRTFEIVATPIEFGGVNLLSADRVKQPEKGLFGALVIEPAGATYDETTLVPDGQGAGSATRSTRIQASITSPVGDAGSGGDYREGLVIAQKINNLRWTDGRAIQNVNQPEFGLEGAEDGGHSAINYATEPPWFRFKRPPDAPFGNAATPNSFGALPNAHAYYANLLVSAEPNSIPISGVSKADDPVTPVIRATAGQPARLHLLNGASTDRDGVFILHGHVWQRDPFVCTGGSQDDEVGLEGRCDPDPASPGLLSPASEALGLNQQAKYMGGEEGFGNVYGHWPILLDSAGGTGAIPGDYLMRDYSPSGNRTGMWGLFRVEE